MCHTQDLCPFRCRGQRRTDARYGRRDRPPLAAHRSGAATEPPVPPPNPFLTGNFAPIDTEHTQLRLAVTGHVPAALLGGTLLRIGPNPVVVPEPESYHWFLGDGMIHGFTFGTDKAGEAFRV